MWWLFKAYVIDLQNTVIALILIIGATTPKYVESSIEPGPWLPLIRLPLLLVHLHVLLISNVTTATTMTVLLGWIAVIGKAEPTVIVLFRVHHTLHAKHSAVLLTHLTWMNHYGLRSPSFIVCWVHKVSPTPCHGWRWPGVLILVVDRSKSSSKARLLMIYRRLLLLSIVKAIVDRVIIRVIAYHHHTSIDQHLLL